MKRIFLDNVENYPKSEVIFRMLRSAMGLLALNVPRHDQLYDRDIRPNETGFLNIYALHRLKQLWDHPDLFASGRFAPVPEATRDRYQYLPFGAGPRVCVGAGFVMMQARIILSMLLARYRFTPAGPAPRPVMHMIVRPESDVELLARPVD